MSTSALIDCPPCRGTGVLRQIDLGDLLFTADLPETEQPWETVPCPICGDQGAFLRVAAPPSAHRCEADAACCSDCRTHQGCRCDGVDYYGRSW